MRLFSRLGPRTPASTHQLPAQRSWLPCLIVLIALPVVAQPDPVQLLDVPLLEVRFSNTTIIVPPLCTDVVGFSEVLTPNSGPVFVELGCAEMRLEIVGHELLASFNPGGVVSNVQMDPGFTFDVPQLGEALTAVLISIESGFVEGGPSPPVAAIAGSHPPVGTGPGSTVFLPGIGGDTIEYRPTNLQLHLQAPPGSDPVAAIRLSAVVPVAFNNVEIDVESLQTRMNDLESRVAELEASNGLAACSDGHDNDDDGLIDLADDGCFGPSDNSEGFVPCGLGVELALVLGVLTLAKRQFRLG